jgi:hypothetical protein
MGLDMYLEKSVYVGAQYEHNGVTGEVRIVRGDGTVLPIELSKISSVRMQAGYWRKANAIHAWFVDNVQDGDDNCGTYYVSKEKLEELLEVCKEVKEDHDRAEELLPTSPGFFFGSYEFDEWYFKDIDFTIELLEGLLSDPNIDMYDFYYQSSW